MFVKKFPIVLFYAEREVQTNSSKNEMEILVREIITTH